MEKLREAQQCTSKIPLVIYDTSSVLLQVLDKIPVQRQVTELIGVHVPVLLDVSIRELRKLAAHREWKTRRAANIALEISTRRFSIFRTGLEQENISADKVILKIAMVLRDRGYPVYVVTCDLELKRSLESRKVKVILFREAKRRLIISDEE